MGINNINKFLRKNCPNIFKTVNLSYLSFKKDSRRLPNFSS